MSKTLQDIQREVDAHIGQFKEGYFPPLTLLARMTEELGELAREVVHAYGEKQKKPEEPPSDIALELGDLLFVMACLANTLAIDLESAHDRVMEKFRTRDRNRFTRVEQVRPDA
ncbi:MAG: nucleotide pyrophosphohydrolase [Firmicutes bacterium]|nr:nucleotide pyrophosphohydrolase [Bacillota bacterium]